MRGWYLQVLGVIYGPTLLHQEDEGFLILEIELTIKSGELFRGTFPDLHVKDEVWRSKLEPGCDNHPEKVLSPALPCTRCVTRSASPICETEIMIIALLKEARINM